jgi:hypothetical protein
MDEGIEDLYSRRGPINRKHLLLVCIAVPSLGLDTTRPNIDTAPDRSLLVEEKYDFRKAQLSWFRRQCLWAR